MRIAATAADFARGVIAVPPLARQADLALAVDANAAMIRHIEAGGIDALMYGGNANLSHARVAEFAALLDLLEAEAGAETWVIPSIGPDYDRVLAMAGELRQRDFPTAMLLPATPSMPAGVARLAALAAEAMRRPVILYVRDPDYIGPADLARLAADGMVLGVKFGRSDDLGLAALVDAVGSAMVVSGVGEQVGVGHIARFGVAGFTSGTACLAPALSQAVFRAAKGGEHRRAALLARKFEAFERLRERTQAIAALHDGVTLTGIADMGPHLPPLAALGAPDSDQAALHGRALMAALP